MIAIYLAPVYIILNLYILRWAYLWMGSCHSILRTMAFRTIFAIIYTIVSTSLVSGFFIKKPRVLHRALKITGNYFLGIFLYSLMIVMAADLGRLFSNMYAECRGFTHELPLMLQVLSVLC